MKGSIVSKGVAIGIVKRIEPYASIGFEKTNQKEYEIAKLKETQKTVVETLKHLAEKTKVNVGQKESEIFQAHQMIIEDPTLMPQIEALIENENRTAPSAVEKVLTDMEEMFKQLDSEYMRERALDIYDIKKRWIKHLKGQNISVDLTEPVILVAEDLTPSDTLELDLNLIAGLIMEKGGVTSHTAILAQSMDIPAIVGCGPLDLPLNVKIILDANQGQIIEAYNEETYNGYLDQLEIQVKEKIALKAFVKMRGITKNQQAVEIGCNIAGLKDVEGVLETGADGVGLFRTEFVYMNRQSAPSEEEQFKIYSNIVKKLEGKPIIFRTMDIGGDKAVDYLNMPKEHNPFLGYRAIRYCLNEVEFFKTQIRAILRATVYGKIKIMFPMIGNVSQFLEAKAIVKSVEKELLEKEIPVKAYELGIMVEIPSAAILAKSFAKHVDFFSIGTNDLTQYTVAVDRQNEQISQLYDYFDPAVLNLIHQVIQVGNDTNTFVGMCGSAAGDPLMIPILMAWGIDELSMASSQVLKAKQLINTLDTHDIKVNLEDLFSFDDHHEVRTYLEGFYQKLNIDI